MFFSKLNKYIHENNFFCISKQAHSSQIKYFYIQNKLIHKLDIFSV